MKVGFVAIVGRPNVGKSTLLNKILDYKLSITSPVPQTTRDQIHGIFNDEDSQIIFIDTPGIHKPKQLLGENLNKASFDSIKEADLILYLQPLDEEIGPGDRFIFEKIKDHPSKVAVMTKLDQGDPEKASARASELKAMGFSEVVGTSDKIANSIDAIVDFIKSKLSEGEPFYDREEITDVSMRFMAKEIIRESAISHLTDEIPHSIGVLVSDFEEPHDDYRSYNISAIIYVERESQQGIVIGAQGAMIKKIRQAAQEKLKALWDAPIRLELKVKTNKKWTQNPEEIKKMGY